jgi:hypothetical protein
LVDQRVFQFPILGAAIHESAVVNSDTSYGGGRQRPQFSVVVDLRRVPVVLALVVKSKVLFKEVSAVEGVLLFVRHVNQAVASLPID